ncbi:hypothetical protein G7Z17_g10388 [Cylindrodendrum hubeiense]|uniref:Polyprotein n=1 Tax=Cylindrodendrum hubeiense TaxID=595255 RepID=A0A9P5L7B0_9HYPO|nr:hypothetical protein G7Z17_g10388 [Cylindrodendrum hubeiense]
MSDPADEGGLDPVKRSLPPQDEAAYSDNEPSKPSLEDYDDEVPEDLIQQTVRAAMEAWKAQQRKKPVAQPPVSPRQSFSHTPAGLPTKLPTGHTMYAQAGLPTRQPDYHTQRPLETPSPRSTPSVATATKMRETLRFSRQQDVLDGALAAAGVYDQIQLSGRGEGKLLTEITANTAGDAFEAIAGLSQGTRAYVTLIQRYEASTGFTENTLWTKLTTLRLKDLKSIPTHINDLSAHAERHTHKAEAAQGSSHSNKGTIDPKTREPAQAHTASKEAPEVTGTLGSNSFTCRAGEASLAKIRGIYERFLASKKGPEAPTATDHSEPSEGIQVEHREPSKAPVGHTFVSQSYTIEAMIPSERDRWLWDSGSDLHIINDTKWFRDNDWAEMKESITVMTGAGPVYPTAVGTALVTLYGKGKETITVSLRDAVCVPSFPLNVFSGEKMYLSGGYLSRNHIMNKEDLVIGTIDVHKRGFLLRVVGGIIGQRGLRKQVMFTHQEVRNTMLWHQRLGHSSPEGVNKTLKATHGGMKPTTVIRNNCDACELAKAVRYSPKAPTLRAQRALDLLHAALYGLKQSGRQWQKKLKDELAELGFEQLKSDTAIYLDPERGIITASYVDDLITVTADKGTEERYYEQLGSNLDVERLGFPRFFLGVAITAADDGSITLTQTDYVRDILETFQMTDCKAASTPMDPGAYPEARKNIEPSPRGLKETYATLIGKLNYLVIQTRPDIAFPTGLWARFTAEPSEAHHESARHILRYLKGNPSRGICYRKQPQETYGNPYGLHGYSDSDYAADPDTSRSTAGYIFMMNGAPISWASKRQPTVAKSTTEAEYYGMSAAVSEAAWIRSFMAELGIPLTSPLVIFADNQSSIKLAHNPEYHARTKHIAVHHHYVREAVANGDVEIRYISTDEMAADGLTKPLAKKKYEEFIGLTGMTS